MAYGLVFAGGGVRGAYHIGVWQALRELNINITAVCGTSIGAVNAALYVNGNFETARQIWSGIALRDIVNLPPNISISEDLFEAKNILKLAREVQRSQGLEMTPLKKQLEQLLDEKTIRKSPIDFGLVIYSLTEKKETVIYKEDIPDGELISYLLASVCLPGFKSVIIDKTKFRDGGLTNNMPVDLLIDRGIKDIITVDVKGIGFYKDFNTAGKNIINISCKKPYTGTMEFDSDGIQKSMREGYLDTLHTFGYLSGNEYFFKTDNYTSVKRIYSDDIITGLEFAAKIFKTDNLKIWDFMELKDAVLQIYSRTKLENELISMLNENKFDISFITKLTHDSQKLCLLTNLLKTDRFDFIKSRLDKVLGDYYKAASAIIYFMEEKDRD